MVAQRISADPARAAASPAQCRTHKVAGPQQPLLPVHSPPAGHPRTSPHSWLLGKIMQPCNLRAAAALAVASYACASAEDQLLHHLPDYSLHSCLLSPACLGRTKVDSHIGAGPTADLSTAANTRTDARMARAGVRLTPNTRRGVGRQAIEACMAAIAPGAKEGREWVGVNGRWRGRLTGCEETL